MNYIPLESVKFSWIFRHKSIPLDKVSLEQIKVMSEQRSAVLWDSFISRTADHPDFFKQGDWAFDSKTWCEHGKWQGIWESDDNALPTLIDDYIQWEDNTTVYYCINRKQVIETNWKNFKVCWKNLLFLDDGTLLIGKKRDEVIQFKSNGHFKVGKK
ncbi:DUF2947 family protein [Thalassotalea sp. G2M2-11]|uniref:DUF2947 family protein n=1 Tax=Thalassotalea sp. G2M2-11 TaxID=2787627 RepID=UPI0019D2C605|nr:DUF2947 family protein [Thalassotalea sp. G2M2-11]